MKSFRLLPFFVFFGVSSAAYAADLAEIRDLPNAVLLEDGLVGGGAPGEGTLEDAAARGIRSVIDLRTPAEGTLEEETRVTDLGMSYFNIPVTPDSLGMDPALRLGRILEDPENRPALMHCSSGNRVGALWALYVYGSREVNSEEALQEGERAGMNKPELRLRVQSLLEPEAETGR